LAAVAAQKEQQSIELKQKSATISELTESLTHSEAALSKAHRDLSNSNEALLSSASDFS
jgi:hypothetical protein